MIEQDNKKAKLREKNKSEDSDNENQLPEGYAQVSLADCIRNINLFIIIKNFLILIFFF